MILSGCRVHVHHVASGSMRLRGGPWHKPFGFESSNNGGVGPARSRKPNYATIGRQVEVDPLTQFDTTNKCASATE